MKKSLRYRESLADVRRVVVKIGSRVLVRNSGRPDVRRMTMLASDIAAMVKSGRQVVLVTSGAIASGMEAIGMKSRPTELPDLQMAAAIGQSRLMARYDSIFSRLGLVVGQVLLTHADFHHSVRLNNARRTMENLIRNKVIPVVNENDVVTDEEIRADEVLGDNDLLASLVVRMVRADLLIILSTVDGLRKHEKRRSVRVRYLEKIDRAAYALVQAGQHHLSKGGMASKLRAAQSVTAAGCSVVIADGRRRNTIRRILEGQDVGTLVVASAAL